MSSKKITLYYPVTVDGEKISELVMRQSKVKDRILVAKMSKDEIEEEVLLFANLCDTTSSVMEGITEADFIQVRNQYTDFLLPPVVKAPAK